MACLWKRLAEPETMAFVCLSSVPAVIRHCDLFHKKDRFNYDGLLARTPVRIETDLKYLMFLNLIISGRTKPTRIHRDNHAIRFGILRRRISRCLAEQGEYLFWRLWVKANGEE
jgi:hypothetical protein